ncbi:MAG: 23S rRNA (guanosine(2251)-2'-O)-methyltransferase RlmB [Acidimicrobiales bacterium]
MKTPGRRSRPGPQTGPRRGPGQDGERSGIGGEQVEGVHAVRELISAGRRRVRSVMIADPTGHSKQLSEIESMCSQVRYPTSPGGDGRILVRHVERHELDRVAASDAPQGVVALAEPLSEVQLGSLVERTPGASAPFLVVLDGVTDPHNLGAIMRSCLGAGATGLVLPRHRSARLGPAALKAAAGAAEHLRIATVAGVPAAVRQLEKAGIWTVGLDASGPAGIWDLAVADEPLALVLGAEGAGLSPLTVARCGIVASIPLQGPLGSLNVSVAAAVACFEVARRRARRV